MNEMVESRQVGRHRKITALVKVRLPQTKDIE